MYVSPPLVFIFFIAGIKLKVFSSIGVEEVEEIRS
jgi:hypothetical protein